MNINLLLKGFFLLGGLVLTTSAGAFAQEKPVPLVLAPCEKMTWKISLVESSTSNSPNGATVSNPNNVASITISKSGEVSKVVVLKKDGSVNQFWRIGKCTLYWVQDRNKILPVEDNLAFPPYPYASSGFYGVEHVNLSDEQKPAVFGQAMCRYFRGILADRRTHIDNASATAVPIEYEAWFDQKTGLPKAYKEKGITFSFHFTTMSEELRLPTEYQAVANKFRADLIKTGRVP